MKLVWEWMETVKEKLKRAGQEKPAKWPFVEQIEGEMRENEIKDGLAERGWKGRREGVREMRSARSRCWRGAKRDQNLPKNFKRKSLEHNTFTLRGILQQLSILQLNPLSDTFRAAVKQAHVWWKRETEIVWDQFSRLGQLRLFQMISQF